MQRLVILTFRISGIEDVEALWRFMVSLLGFRPDRRPAKSDFVFLENPSFVEEPENAFVFEDYDAIGLCSDSKVASMGWPDEHQRKKCENRDGGLQESFLPRSWNPCLPYILLFKFKFRINRCR